MISAVIITKNEEKNIGKCLDTLTWCDEIIVIDDLSTDKTAEIVKKKGAKLFSREMNGNFAAQRNFGLSKTKGDWVFFVDADERVSAPLWYEIMAETNESNNEVNGYYIKRQDTMWGRTLKYGETGTMSLLRLAKRNAGQWEGKVHEVWKISGKVAVLKNHLTHYPHDSIEEFLREINFYTDIRAAELYERKVKAYWWSPIVYPVAKFKLNYILGRGFLDGLPGFVFAMLMSFHSFMVRSKLWVMWQKSK